MPSNSTYKYRSAKELFVSEIVSDSSRKRSVLVVPVSSLDKLIKEAEKNDHRVEHIYDYWLVCLYNLLRTMTWPPIANPGFKSWIETNWTNQVDQYWQGRLPTRKNHPATSAGGISFNQGKTAKIFRREPGTTLTVPTHYSYVFDAFQHGITTVRTSTYFSGFYEILIYYSYNW